MSNKVTKTVQLKLQCPKSRTDLFVNGLITAVQDGWTRKGNKAVVHSGSTMIRVVLEKEVEVSSKFPREVVWNCHGDTYPKTWGEVVDEVTEQVKLLKVEATNLLQQLSTNSSEILERYENETWVEWDNGELGQSEEHTQLSEDSIPLEQAIDQGIIKTPSNASEEVAEIVSGLVKTLNKKKTSYTLEEVKALKWVEIAKAAAKYNLPKMKRPELELELVRVSNLEV